MSLSLSVNNIDFIGTHTPATQTPLKSALKKSEDPVERPAAQSYRSPTKSALDTSSAAPGTCSSSVLVY